MAIYTLESPYSPLHLAGRSAVVDTSYLIADSGPGGAHFLHASRSIWCAPHVSGMLRM